MRESYRVELLSDVVLSQSSATEGAHRTLDYLPGSTFLGSVAGKLYSRLDAREAYCAFHSGRLRFGHGLPVFGSGHEALPVPLSIHREKLDDSQLYDLSHPEAPRPRQARQLREGYVSRGGELCGFMPKRSCAKVALARSPLSRHAAEGAAGKNQLFAYEALAMGSLFQFSLEADDDVDPSLFEQVCEALTEAPLRLGRSRSSEYGAVRLTRHPNALPAEEAGAWGREFRLLLASDVALRDPDTGQPTCTPWPRLFGLSNDARLIEERSYLKTRRYSPFNGKRRRPDLERQVLCQGSVLVFQQDREPPEPSELQARLHRGVGEHREQGLGVVVVNPSCLAQPTPQWRRVEASTAAALEGGSIEGDELLAFVRRKSQQQKLAAALYQQSREWATKMLPYSRQHGGPGRAQWGTIMQLAARAESGEALRKLLFSSDGFVYEGVSKHAWDATHQRCSAADQLKGLVDQELQDHGDGSRLPLLLQKVARRVLHLMSQSGEEATG